MKKESILTKEGVFGCDHFNLHFWKQRRSTLLWRVVFTAVGKNKSIFFSVTFSRKELSFHSRREKQVDCWCRFLQKKLFFTAEKKNKWIFGDAVGTSVFKNSFLGIIFQMN
jgi:hypothetical protein